MDIREINTYEQFISLQDQWNDLLQVSNHTIFSTWEWLDLWWRHFGKNKNLAILLAEKNNDVIGIAPLMYSVETMFKIRRKVIEFIGGQHPIYSNFIISGSHNECIEHFFSYLNSLPKKWNSAELINISKDPKSLRGLNQVVSKIMPDHTCLCVKLPNSNDSFINSIKRKDRKEFRRNLRKIRKDGLQLNLVECLTQKDVTDTMNTLFSLDKKRWKNAENFSGKCSDRNCRNFYVDVAKSFFEKGWLGLYTLELSGTPVASLFGFRYNSKFYAYIMGMDPMYRKYSVGNLLFLKVMEDCIQKGLNEFDFMAGTDNYKNQWNPVTTCTFKTSIPRKGLMAHIKFLIYKNYWSHGRRLKYYQKKRGGLMP